MYDVKVSVSEDNGAMKLVLSANCRSLKDATELAGSWTDNRARGGDAITPAPFAIHIKNPEGKVDTLITIEHTAVWEILEQCPHSRLDSNGILRIKKHGSGNYHYAWLELLTDRGWEQLHSVGLYNSQSADDVVRLQRIISGTERLKAYAESIYRGRLSKLPDTK